MIPFEKVDKLFTKLKDVYGDPHYKEHAIEKFKKLKMGMGFFNAFYSKFIQLEAKLEFTKDMLLQKFMHKLYLRMQNQMISELEYLDNIKDLTMHFQKICDQIIATNWVQ